MTVQESCKWILSIVVQEWPDLLDYSFRFSIKEPRLLVLEIGKRDGLQRYRYDLTLSYEAVFNRDEDLVKRELERAWKFLL